MYTCIHIALHVVYTQRHRASTIRTYQLLRVAIHHIYDIILNTTRYSVLLQPSRFAEDIYSFGPVLSAFSTVTRLLHHGKYSELAS